MNHERLKLLRQFHGKTQSELAEDVAVSQAAIAFFESGQKDPQANVAEALGTALNVDAAFLFDSDEDRFVESEYNFRSLKAAPDRLRKKVGAQAALFGIVVRKLRTYVPKMPKVNVPSFPGSTEAEIEKAAAKTRTYWGIPADEPIDSMIGILESNGVVGTVADANTAESVDAFSRYGATAVVVLNTAKESASRSFFDTAHEAGHGVLHHGQPEKPHDQRESEAQLFASAFLMPRIPFTRAMWSSGGNVDWTNLFEIKEEWGTSVAAIIFRAYHLGLIDAVTYRKGFREMSRRGWRTSEPEEPTAEVPQLFAALLAQYQKNTKRSVADLAAELHMSNELFRKVTSIAPVSQSVLSLTDRLSTKTKAPRR